MKKDILSHLERRNELTDKIYDYLVNNALGHEKRVKSVMLVKEYL